MRILICPINWGLGHASRDVLIVHRLLNLGHEVILAGDGVSLQFLQTELPGLASVHLPSTLRITYFKHLPAWLKISILSPFLLYEILAEHKRLKKIIRTVRPDLLISDNRYGVWSQDVKSVLITHQCNVKLPGFLKWLEYPVTLVLRSFIERFDQCWIPDYPGTQNLSGDLAHRFPVPSNAIYIGPLSRFAVPVFQPQIEARHECPSQEELPDARLLVLLSGPEPQRSRLERIILEQVANLPLSTIILRGLPGIQDRKKIGPGHAMISHLPSPQMKQLIKNAAYIICRSGYTSIMDLAAMKKKAILIPTPGQTEQEYLADYLTRKGVFLSGKQKKFGLKAAISMLEKFEPVFNFPGEDLLTPPLEGF